MSIFFKHNFTFLVEMALGGGSSGGTVPHFNQAMLQNLQSMLMANPSYLTGGIPNKLLSQMWTPDLTNKTGNNMVIFINYFVQS